MSHLKVMKDIKMLDLQGPNNRIRQEIDSAMAKVIDEAVFINGRDVKQFEVELSNYLLVQNVISCANGTDALQLALQALNLNRGDEVIVPAFTYVSAAEVIALLGLIPKWIDVDERSFNMDPNLISAAISPKTKAIIPVHLFGQCADMEPILKIAHNNGLYVVEDAAQSINAAYTFSDKNTQLAGTMGHIGCTSFFPSKNLGCFGDGGALYSNDQQLANRIRMIANHGQQQKYTHELVGINSRLDNIQAAVLRIKLKHLNEYSIARQSAAKHYDNLLKGLPDIKLPFRSANSSHVFNQYTIQVANGQRNELKAFLMERGIPTMIYYPIPVHLQKAYLSSSYPSGTFEVSELLATSVLSLPMHTELDEDQQSYICESIAQFYKQ